MNIDNARSYKTEANLVKRIEYLYSPETKYLVVCNRKGRFTAVFPLSWNPINPGHIASDGFPVVG